MTRPEYGGDLSPAAWRDLQALQRQHPDVYKQIVTRFIPQLAIDPLTGSEPLYGDLAGMRSLHFGRKPEFRLIFEVIQRLVLVVAVAAHDDAYRRAKDRR